MFPVLSVNKMFGISIRTKHHRDCYYTERFSLKRFYGLTKGVLYIPVPQLDYRTLRLCLAYNAMEKLPGTIQFILSQGNHVLQKDKE